MGIRFVGSLSDDNDLTPKWYVDDAISGLVGVHFDGPYQSLSELPGVGSGDTIYLVENSGSAENYYDEYLWYDDVI